MRLNLSKCFIISLVEYLFAPVLDHLGNILHLTANLDPLLKVHKIILYYKHKAHCFHDHFF